MSAHFQDIDMSTTTLSNESNVQEKSTSVLLPLKRKRDDGIQGPEIYTIFINQFIDILAQSPQAETIRDYHSLFHVNKATQTAFLTSSSLAAKREQFEFAKCLEGLVPHCHLTVFCPKTQQTYVFRFEPPAGIILHFRSRYCKMITPEDVAPDFNAMMMSGRTPKDRPLCSFEDFRRIWKAVGGKVRNWPDDFLYHERHMGITLAPSSSAESEEMYKRMGYTNVEDPTPVTTRLASHLGAVLSRIEEWRKREEERALTRLADIEKQRKLDNESSDAESWVTEEYLDEHDDAEMGDDMGEIEVTRDEMSKEKSTPVKSEQQPAKLRRSPRLLART